MFKRILVPLDGSTGAERAIPFAARLAHASHGSIMFVQVILPPVAFGTYSAERSIALKPTAFETRLDKAENYLTGSVTRYASDLGGIEVATEVIPGAASPTIFSTARFEGVDLIVMCSHGETGLKRWMFGSVAHEAVRHSPVPVLVLHEHAGVPPVSDVAHPLQVLVPLDGSPLAEIALEPAIQLIAALAPAQGRLHILRVVDLPSSDGHARSQAHLDAVVQEEARREAEAYLKTVADRLREATSVNLKLSIISSVVVSTDVAGTITGLAEQTEGTENTGSYRLIVMATHGWGGVRRIVMGSVTEHVLDATKLPLLIIRA